LPSSLKIRKGVKFSEIFLQNTSIFARRLKKEGKGQRFSKMFLQNTSNFARKPKKKKIRSNF